MDVKFDRQEYLIFEEIFEAGQIDDVTKERCEFSDDIEDMVYELAYTRYELAKCEARHNALREAVKRLVAADDDLLKSWDAMANNGPLECEYHAARAEVDRLLEEL